MNKHQKIAELSSANKSFVIATIVKTTGSTPGKVGFNIIVEDNHTLGTVGGGAIEMEVIAEARKKMRGGESEMKEYLLSDKVKNAEEGVKLLQMSCNGKVWVYYEVHCCLPKVYVFGGGHVGGALLYFLNRLPYQSILIDNRPEFANESRNGSANEIVLSDYVEYASRFQPEENSYIVILTQQHIYDYDVMKTIYKRNLTVKYVGVIASKVKAKTLVEKLNKELEGPVNLSNLHTPVGLVDIGGNSAEEIALSIAAQLQKIKTISEQQ